MSRSETGAHFRCSMVQSEWDQESLIVSHHLFPLFALQKNVGERIISAEKGLHLFVEQKNYELHK